MKYISAKDLFDGYNRNPLYKGLEPETILFRAIERSTHKMEILEVDREEFERLMKQYSAERDTVIGGKEDVLIGKEDILSCLQRAVEEQALPELP